MQLKCHKMKSHFPLSTPSPFYSSFLGRKTSLSNHGPKAVSWGYLAFFFCPPVVLWILPLKWLKILSTPLQLIVSALVHPLIDISQDSNLIFPTDLSAILHPPHCTRVCVCARACACVQTCTYAYGLFSFPFGHFPEATALQ